MDEDKKNYPQLHIQLLEPRIMFDGAAIYAASEAIAVSYTHLTLPTKA